MFPGGEGKRAETLFLKALSQSGDKQNPHMKMRSRQIVWCNASKQAFFLQQMSNIRSDCRNVDYTYFESVKRKMSKLVLQVWLHTFSPLSGAKRAGWKREQVGRAKNAGVACAYAAGADWTTWGIRIRKKKLPDSPIVSHNYKFLPYKFLLSYGAKQNWIVNLKDFEGSNQLDHQLERERRRQPTHQTFIVRKVEERASTYDD